MHVTLVCTGAQNLALEALTPYLRFRGHQVSVAFDPGLFDDKYFLNIPPLAKLFNQSQQTIQKIVDAKPDLVGFTVMTNMYRWALSMAAEVKKQIDVPVVFGGIHPSSAPEVVIAEDVVDYVVQGEGDYALADLADALARGEDGNGIDNVWTKQSKGPVPLRNLVENLDELPPMDKTIFLKEGRIQDLCLIITSRGCPYRCAYCCHSYLKKIYHKKGAYLRRRSVEAVIEECRSLKTDHGVKVFSFMDDVFTLDKTWLENFAAQYKAKVGNPFLCNIHVQNFSEDTARLLKETGCVRLDFGIQSMNENIRKEVLNRSTTNERIREVMGILDHAGLAFHIHHIFGLPGDTEQDYIDAARFYMQPNRLEKVNCFFLSYFPGTDILDYALSHELIDKAHVQRFLHGEEDNYYQGGSLTGLGDPIVEIAANYEKLFTLIPLIPKKLSKWILENNRTPWLRKIPWALVVIYEAVLALLKKNHRVKAYSKYYLYNIGRALLFKIGLK